MTLNNAVSLVRRAMLWRSLRNRLLVDLGWLGMLFAGLALTDRLAPLVDTPWSLLLLIASAFLLARLVWCARRIQLERTSVLLLADEALGAPETLVTADELSREASAEDADGTHHALTTVLARWLAPVSVAIVQLPEARFIPQTRARHSSSAPAERARAR